MGECLGQVADRCPGLPCRVDPVVVPRLVNLDFIPGGQTRRWNCLELIPVAGPLVGAAWGALDSFLVHELLPESGPVAFLSGLYQSFFKPES